MEADKGVVRHTFENLSRISGLVHGVFTRHGGVSAPPFASLNAAWNIGDSQDAVRENLLRIKTELGLKELVAGPQVHGDTIHVIDEDALSSAEERPPVRVTPPGDALMTQLRGVGLMIKVADCQAIFLVDPVRRVIANIHSGWRGSVCNLAAKTVRCMHDHYGCRPEDMLATIGPSLGPCCAEFKNYRKELPTAFWRYQVKADYFDFWAISRDQLIQAGLRDENIEAAGRCTVCETNHFFSYRGERTTGRLAAVVGWKS
ncbi:peptidoglycan editing factor PgeF [Desulforhabdus amnigena]|nr:peptidoglycan editing factor PgeF [Desulforhabdus amnigena]NLJ29079.1 peptidoglycan editing factor PgeF [Deltaproteobacteria bacterium]